MGQFATLCVELKNEVVSYLGPEDLLAMRGLSKGSNNLALPHIWRSVYEWEEGRHAIGLLRWMVEGMHVQLLAGDPTLVSKMPYVVLISF